MEKKVKIGLLIVCLLIIFLSGCRTQGYLHDEWINPAWKNKKWPMEKFIIAALLKNSSESQEAENIVVSQYPAQAISSFAYFGERNKNIDTTYYLKKAEKDRINMVVVAKLVNLNYRVWSANKSIYTTSWSRDINNRIGSYQRIKSDIKYAIQVDVYHTGTSEQVWTGFASVLNPANSSDLTKTVIRTIKRAINDAQKKHTKEL